MSPQGRIDLQFQHRVSFVDDALNPADATLADAVRNEHGQPSRMLAFIEQAVLGAWPDLPQRLRNYAAHHADALSLVGDPLTLPGGERAKNDRAVFDNVCAAIHDARIDRQSYILVIGGGAALDIVGFAAAIAHRGVRLLRMPTTTLAQADSGVGVKCGINAFGKKNYLGAFAVPAAVINDQSLLTSLPDADWNSGFSEAVKVALVKDAALLDDIEKNAPAIVRRDMTVAMPIVQRSAQLHFDHIVHGGDPFELTTARPLDFGHWAAHKLEQLTDFSLRHGDAVAIGLALDTLYSHMIGLAPAELPRRVIACLQSLALPVTHRMLKNPDALLAGLEEFREHLGGQLTITLLRQAGNPVDVHEIDHATMRQAMAYLSRTSQGSMK